MIRPRVDPFTKCVYGPINSPSHGAGAPDGSVEPSVVIDHRQVVTVKPIKGAIAVAIVPSPYGGLAIARGSATFACNGTEDGTSYIQHSTAFAHDFNPIDATATSTGTSYALLPFKESLRNGGAISQSQTQGLQATKFRVLTSQAQAEFTGSTMYNSGVAATAKIAHHAYEDVIQRAPAGLDQLYTVCSNGARLAQAPPGSLSDVSSLPGSNTFPARQSVMMINAPQEFEYQEMRNQWCAFTSTDNSHNSQTAPLVNRYFAGPLVHSIGDPANDPVPGIGYSTVTYYAAEGLADDATITFELRTCVEYTLAFTSPAARFTSLPASENSRAIKVVKEIGRSIPSSFPVTPAVESSGWLSNALSWYGHTMASVVGSVYSAGGAAIKNFGPMGQVLGAGTQSIGGGLLALGN